MAGPPLSAFERSAGAAPADRRAGSALAALLLTFWVGGVVTTLLYGLVFTARR